MRPFMTVLDSADLGLADSIGMRYFFLRSSISSNRTHITGGQFGRSASFASIRSAMSHAITLVVACCIPSKIGEFVISNVTIIMACLLSFLGRPHERQQNKSVYAAHFLSIVLPEHDIHAPIYSGCGWFLKRLFCYRKHIAHIGNVIKRLVPNYGTPSLSHFKYPHERGYGDNSINYGN